MMSHHFRVQQETCIHRMIRTVAVGTKQPVTLFSLRGESRGGVGNNSRGRSWLTDGTAFERRRNRGRVGNTVGKFSTVFRRVRESGIPFSIGEMRLGLVVP